MAVDDANGMIVVVRDGYRVLLERDMGAIAELHTPGSEASWVATLPAGRFAAPFFNGTQEQESPLALHLVQPTRDADPAEDVLVFASRSGLTQTRYTFGATWIDVDTRLPRDSGPRAGLSLDLNILDMPTGTSWTEQVTPVVLYTDEALRYAYFIWQRSAHEYLVLLVNGPFAAWRIKYSFHGHRMAGFQVLSQADDVHRRDRTPLPVVERLRVRLAFADLLHRGLALVAQGLDLALAVPALSGGIVGVSIPWVLHGEASSLQHCAPDGAAQSLPIGQKHGVLTLQQPGMHQLITTSPSGRQHVTRLFAHEAWEAIYDRSNRFHRDHYQHPSGAYYRVISIDTLMPDKLTFEGIQFGDPWQPMSCRTGEFGGFCAWAMIKNMLIYGLKDEFLPGVQRYLFHWALSRGHEDQPYPGTVSKQPFTFLGRDYSAYHLWKEINYPQHEVFLLGELVDYFRLTGDRDALEEAVSLGGHFIHDHVKESGMVVCQNAAQSEERDYTTVDVPVVNITLLGHTLQGHDAARAAYFLSWAERMADFLVRRGPDFQTEGEACTEDGSMACTAASVLYAYLHVAPKPEYLRLGEQILTAHDKLMLKGCDARMHRSSLRFWETQYESRAWGPSINAGHGWTMWTAQAMGYMYRITHRIAWLCEAYASTLCNLTRIDHNGGFFPCYTPDMIPGTPHHHSMLHVPLQDAVDTRKSSSFVAMGYPDAYSASGNHVLIRTAEVWANISGLLVENRVPINGYLDAEGTFVSAAPCFDHLALSAVPREPLFVATSPGQVLTVTCDGMVPDCALEGVTDVVLGDRQLHCRVTGTRVTIQARVLSPGA